MQDVTVSVFSGAVAFPDEVLTFTVAGETSSALVQWFVANLKTAIEDHGHHYREPASAFSSAVAQHDAIADQQTTVRLVLNRCDVERPRPVQRNGQGTFVVSVFEGSDNQREVMRAAYPLLLRSLSNMIVYLTRVDSVLEAHFITIEQGHYIVRLESDEASFFTQIYGRVQPLACSHLVINNNFEPNLPEHLWNGDEATRQISEAGRKLDQMGLLPAAIPIHEFLSERELRHVRRLYNIGGLSYGNLSARALHNPNYFWMSASGVDKGKLQTIGRDIMLVTDYEPPLTMRLSVPANVEPRRVSVDAIEHFMIYREHPDVGAIVHVHAWWRDPIPSTMMNYPCGTYELASEVAELVRRAPDPSRAVIGLKNHGLTITGHSIAEIFARIEPMIVPQVPMS